MLRPGWKQVKHNIESAIQSQNMIEQHEHNVIDVYTYTRTVGHKDGIFFSPQF